jgi:hypothetical protein
MGRRARVARASEAPPLLAGGPSHHHGGPVGQSLKEFDGLGVADHTLVYTTDNGAGVCAWPDGGGTPSVRDKEKGWPR